MCLKETVRIFTKSNDINGAFCWGKDSEEMTL